MRDVKDVAPDQSEHLIRHEEREEGMTFLTKVPKTRKPTRILRMKLLKVKILERQGLLSFCKANYPLVPSILRVFWNSP